VSSLYDVWTDRDVAIHEAILADGRTPHAKSYAYTTLEGWKRYCETKPENWEVPLFNPGRHYIVAKGAGEAFHEPCFNSGWVYVGRFEVRRCTCRPSTSKLTRKEPWKETALVPYSAGVLQ
jgi:hypothetical protein